MKKVFVLMFFFLMSLTLPLANATIDVVGGNKGISISGTSKLRLHISCEMGHSHAYTSQCQTDPPTGHSERTNIPSKVTLTMSGTASGYGAAGGAFRKAVIDGETVADWNGDVGEQYETLKTQGVCGFNGTSPEAYTEDKTIDFDVYGDSTEKLGADHKWSATAGIYTRGIEWIGTATSSVSVGALVDLDETPSLSVSATTSSGLTMKYQQAQDRGWSGKTVNDVPWEVVALYKCHTCGGNSESSSAWLRLSSAHSHHFVCGGCGKHIKCKNNKGDHVEVSCPLGPNNQICSYGSYYKCSPHTHDYGSSSGSNPTGSTPPSDGTPNCPDCTSHCSPPCLCSNSGTCNGTVSYHACGEHETTVSGDHSLQASCSLTNASGQSCTVTSFYACQSHTCVFPAPPPPPPTVSCGRSGCSESVSSSNEHRVGPCSGCSQSYWSCSWSASYWENEHRLRTCRYGTCGNTWRRCQSSTPNCLSPNRQGERCWAADP